MKDKIREIKDVTSDTVRQKVRHLFPNVREKEVKKR